MKVVAFDTETRGLDWFNPDQHAFLATWADEVGEYHADLSDPAQVSVFRHAIDEADVIVCHNLKFDVHMVRETLGFDPIEGKQIHDTDLLSRVVYPEGNAGSGGTGHGLKGLAKVFLRADADAPEEAIKDMAKSIGLRTIKQTGAYHQVWRAYPEVMEEYARQDARYTFDLYEKFTADLKGLDRIYDLEREVLPILLRAETLGTATDQVSVARLKAQFTAERAELCEYLSAELGAEVLGGEGSGEALTEALLALGVPLYKKTATTGKLATNKFALQEFEKDYPVIGALEEFRRVERFLSTYIGAVEGRPVIHPSFGQCAAWTGRMSCRSPNLQNFPKRAGKEVRAVLVPRPGHAFVVCDYEGIEIRLLAYYLNDPEFIKLVGSGTHDPHAWMCTHIWGGKMSDYVKGSAKEETHRLPAKNILFAITYGAGRKRVANMLHDAGLPSTEDDAAAIISKIKSTLPNWWPLQKRIKAKIEKYGYVNTMFGRKQVVKKDKAYVGLNAIIQGSAADICKLGLVNVDRAVQDLGATPLLVVHDEIVVECPIEHADECLKRMELAMCDMGDMTFEPRLAVSGTVVTTSYADA